MEVYKFDKNLLERMDQFLNVLSWRDDPLPASAVKAEWTYYIEVQIEPTGWQAIWKIPRVICQEMRIKYPVFVFGVVSQVLFKDLKAIFHIIAVQDDTVRLPEQQEVQLEDLWVTKQQENTEMNIEKTAEILDSLRFFYNNLWMPWDFDNDDDLDWADKNLKTRIRFYYDIKKNSMKKSTINRIKNLLVEARYLQNRREYLEMGLSDDEYDDEILERNEITDLMRVHLRLSIIRNEIEILENPRMREIYEEFKYDENEEIKKNNKNDMEKAEVFIVSKPGTLKMHTDLLNEAQNLIDSDKIVKMCPRFQDALNICNVNDTILLSAGKHRIKFLEHFNGNNSIIGIKHPDSNELVEITSYNDKSILLAFDGDYTLKNIVLDCKNMVTGVYIKNCKVTFENCSIIGNEDFNNTHGIILFGNAELILIDCLIENFYTGIIQNNNSKLLLINSKIQSCGIGLELNALGEVEFRDAKILNCKNVGIAWEISLIKHSSIDFRNQIHDNVKDMFDYLNMPWKGNCSFENNIKANILLMNNTYLKVHKDIMKTNISYCLEDVINDCIENTDDNKQNFDHDMIILPENYN